MADANIQNRFTQSKFVIPSISFDPTERYEQRYVLAESFAKMGFVQLSNLVHQEHDEKVLSEYSFIIRNIATRMKAERILLDLDVQGL